MYRSNNHAPLVLVADDDRLIRVLVRKSLEAEGFRVEEAADGHEVISAFYMLQPDLIFLDVIMPGQDGFCICKQIRSMDSGDAVPIVMMTGLDDHESVKKAYEAGATDFITKPLNLALIGHRAQYVIRSSRALENLKQSEARLVDAQSIANLGSWEFDLVSGEIYCSREVYNIFGIEPGNSRITHEVFMDAVHPQEKDAVAERMRKALMEDSNFTIECRIMTQHGRERSILTKARINRDETAKATWVVGFIQDITERKEVEEKIKQLAYYDTLTGLPNRILFQDNFSHAISFAKRTKTQIGILFVDLDRFKQINDTLGHAVGDKVLQEVAERLNAGVRKYDYVTREPVEGIDAEIARFAGDEFIIMLKNVRDHFDAAKVAQRIQDSLAMPYTIDGTEIIVTPSIGISLYPVDGERLEDLIKFADIAMYHAKELGRNNFQFYSRSLDSTAKDHLILEGQLRNAVKRNELFVVYQPIMQIPSFEISGIEALVRWRHPEHGVLSASHFVPMAEETGLITEIDEWVLHTVCRQIKAWQDRFDRTLEVSVNVSGRNFKKRTLVETVVKTLQNTKIEPERLKLEITEGVLINNDEYVVSALNSLKGMGIRLALDDFGTGYSSLGYLRKFPLDILKIDKTFVRDILVDHDCTSIITAIIALARSLKLDIIAEGVETKDQMELLLQKGCEKQQGNYFSPPLSLADLEEFLQHGITDTEDPAPGKNHSHTGPAAPV
ncbi:MAG: EAL domain-containing protein [Geobacteraceae bacterium]|nr:EAL domain-containing protein [Geobacteraceae bacterium]